jgi:acyl carrier protein
MTQQEVLDKLRPLVSEVTGVPSTEIEMHHVLVTDLGAESLDLLDLSFLIEEAFGITIEPNELEQQAKARRPDVAYEKDGYLTMEALEELRKELPDVDPERLRPGLRRAVLPSLLPVSTFVRIIERKVAAVARYASQQHRRYADGDYIWNLARVHGTNVNREFAEVFQVYRLVA